MKKSHVLFVSAALLAFLVFGSASYAFFTYPKVLVYKGTIKASKSLIDVNDTNNLVTNTTKILYVTQISESNDHFIILDHNAVIYDTRAKYYKLLSSGSGQLIDNSHGAVMCLLSSSSSNGNMIAFFSGKGKLTKYSNDPNAPKAYIPPAFNGSGWMIDYDIFDPNYKYEGTVSVSLKLDAAATRKASADANTPLEVVNDQISKFESQGGWTRWGN